jgi:hypothetical protein
MNIATADAIMRRRMMTPTASRYTVSVWIWPVSESPARRISATGDRMQSITPVEIFRDALSL